MNEIVQMVKYVLGFGIAEKKITAIWGGDGRCIIEVPGKGAFEIFVRPYNESVPPDVIVERSNDRPRENPTA